MLVLTSWHLALPPRVILTIERFQCRSRPRCLPEPECDTWRVSVGRDTWRVEGGRDTWREGARDTWRDGARDMWREGAGVTLGGRERVTRGGHLLTSSAAMSSTSSHSVGSRPLWSSVWYAAKSARITYSLCKFHSLGDCRPL